eukprot:357713-Chlamydomonas_euryale.AAC.20
MSYTFVGIILSGRWARLLKKQFGFGQADRADHPPQAREAEAADRRDSSLPRLTAPSQIAPAPIHSLPTALPPPPSPRAEERCRNANRSLTWHVCVRDRPDRSLPPSAVPAAATMRLLSVPQGSLSGRPRSWAAVAPPRSSTRSFRPAPAAPSPRGAGAASRAVATAGSRTDTLRRLLRQDGILKARAHAPHAHGEAGARMHIHARALVFV